MDAPPTSPAVMRYIASWLTDYIGEPTQEIAVPEMEEFLYQHGYSLVPPDDTTVFTPLDYWRATVWVARQAVRRSDRVVGSEWRT
jgi:hypothetical protein